MIATAAAKYDISRFGMELFRASPRQADLFIVAGTVTNKMAPVVRRLWEQMPDPKWVVAMGNCAVSGGPSDLFRPPGGGQDHPRRRVHRGVPSDAQGLLNGLITLQNQIARSHPTLEIFDRDARRTD